MSYPTPVAIIVTLVFVLTGSAYLLRAARDRDPVGRLSDVLHVVMSFSMLSMPWAWGMVVFPPVLQIIVFSLAALFYLALLVGSTRPATRTDPELAASGHHHGGRLRAVFHVLMMAAMVVMAVMMNGMGSGHEGMQGGAMAANPLNNAISVSFLVVFAAAAVWYLVGIVRERRSPGVVRLNLLMMAGMSAGMSLAFWPIW